ncbi:MAG: ribose 5-phosphate isomerase B [Chloroflexi bacterium]|nr:ribose 5-phosphate isomerase B [Chloroflexota bacterium]
MRVAIGCDHNGLALKNSIINLVVELGCEYEDFGCYDSGSVDYPDIARTTAEAVVSGRFEQGILICSSGVGMSISANKVKGIRAALCHDTFSAQRAREHTDANILCLGGWVIGDGLAKDIVRVFLNSQFSGGRHARRLEKVRELECDR